ncbi:MAG: hypothetical protein ABR927_01035 [Bacteroidales bacterium]|jgi:hypothetical protein
MMKKVLFILVLMMAALVVNAQTKVNSQSTQPLKKGDRVAQTGQPTVGRRIQLIGLGTFIVKKRAYVPTSPAMSLPAGDRTALTAAEVPKPIADNIAKDYVGYTIKDATKVVKDKVLSYEVNIIKGATTETIVYEQVVENPAPK